MNTPASKLEVRGPTTQRYGRLPGKNVLTYEIVRDGKVIETVTFPYNIHDVTPLQAHAIAKRHVQAALNRYGES